LLRNEDTEIERQMPEKNLDFLPIVILPCWKISFVNDVMSIHA